MTLSTYKNAPALSLPRPQIGIVLAMLSSILAAAILFFLGAIFYWNVLSFDADCGDSKMGGPDPPPARIEPDAKSIDFLTDASPAHDCEYCDPNFDPR
jgi:hypothetical protein